MQSISEREKILHNKLPDVFNNKMAREKQKRRKKDPLSKDIYCILILIKLTVKNNHYHHHQGVLKYMFNANKKLLF